MTTGPNSREAAQAAIPATVFDDEAAAGARSYAEALLKVAEGDGQVDAALGELEEHSAIAMLDTFASAARETPERDSAQQAIDRLRSAGKPADNLKDLRDEVIELQKSQRDLKKDLDALKKQLEKKNEKKPQPGGK